MEAFLKVVNETYVINMDKDIERLQGFDDMMKKSNWSYKRHAGINVRDNNDNVRKMKEKYSERRYPIDITLGELGCLISHVSLWEKVAYDQDLNRILIFEDDARTYVDGDSIRKKIVEFYETTENDPDILFLGKCLDYCHAYQHVWDNIYDSKHPLCAHSYIMTKKGANKLLQRLPFNKAIDMVMVENIQNNNVTAMVFHPSIYYQDIFRNGSNLREKQSLINVTQECIISQQYISNETWEYIVFPLIGIFCLLILFCYYIYDSL